MNKLSRILLCSLFILLPFACKKSSNPTVPPGSPAPAATATPTDVPLCASPVTIGQTSGSGNWTVDGVFAVRLAVPSSGRLARVGFGTLGGALPLRRR
jgi:hypothetical protein